MSCNNSTVTVKLLHVLLYIWWQERRSYGCRWSAFLVVWSSEWNWYSGFRKETPSLETKLQCDASFPSHQCFCREIRSAACNSSPWELKIGTWCSPVAMLHIMGAQGCWRTAVKHPTVRNLHQETGTLAGKKCFAYVFQEWGCSFRHCFASPLPTAWMGTWRSWGRQKGVGAVCLPVSLWPCLPCCWYCCLGNKLLGALDAAGPRLMSARMYQL